MFDKFSKSITIVLLGAAFLCGSGLPAEAKSPRGWGTARQLFLRGVLANPKQPSFIRGGLQNQVNRWRRLGKTGFPRLKYPIGYYPMHRGSVDIRHFRLGTARDNRSRPQRSKAQGRKTGILRHYW